MNAKYPLVKHPLVLAFGTLLAFSLACGGGGWGPMGGNVEDTPDWKGHYNPPKGHNEPAKHSEPGHISDATRQRMSSPLDKPLPNTVVIKDKRGTQWNLYQPAPGYVWSNGRDRGPRTYEYVVPVVKSGK